MKSFGSFVTDDDKHMERFKELITAYNQLRVKYEQKGGEAVEGQPAVYGQPQQYEQQPEQAESPTGEPSLKFPKYDTGNWRQMKD
ncbi:hypothetical protein RHSIM_Rhsim08G0183800 [Rhododendron simsii]|uniref:Uncharacterized protein n=1 Tax=Rhododendron simsii TaxID=118357 RepID=A0A834GHF1_RHOSS|nr:hypothetical protein RHSIM_Rhsim08G0183800 [Rhododendron simsii]